MSFERLAPHYTWMEVVLAGRRLKRARVAWIDALAGSRDILIAGVGHGHFLRSCLKRFPEARITSVDASSGMLRRARQRALAAGGAPDCLTFVRATLPDWQPPAAAFDAIVTHFFLDCFPPDELGAVIHNLARAARPQARWLLSDFALPPAGLARRRALIVHSMMYAFFRRVTRLRARRWTEPAPRLIAAGFALAGRKNTEWGLLRSDLWQRGCAAPTGDLQVG